MHVCLQTKNTVKCNIFVERKAFEHVDHFVGLQGLQTRPAYARSLAPWAICSISGNGDTSSPHRTLQDMIYDCSIHPNLWCFNFITVLSLEYPMFTGMGLLISVHND